MMRLGAQPVGDGATRFEVWAPAAGRVAVELDGRSVDLAREATTWVGVVDGVGHGDRYRIRLDDDPPLADPASAWQPDGVHGPSAVVDASRFVWHDDGWTGVALADTVLYELHVGTFTAAGTFDGVAGQLARLADLGVTTIELMPVSAVPGLRNWGYDGVFPWSVHEPYGGPEGLARLVDAAHGYGLAVMLDVVYNHLGPEGNVLGRVAPYFTDATKTPWGAAVNVAGRGSDEVRRYFVESARRWVDDFHVDGLRLDAVDAIPDQTARPFLEELADAVHTAGAEHGRTVLVVAESASNDPRLVRSPEAGGIGCDAMWNDDVHHALRVALTGDRRGYYADYDGAGDLATAYARGWVFEGRYSHYRGRRHGRPATGVSHDRLVVFWANHDHVGNTPAGARPPFGADQRLLAAASVLLSPFTPMLFMGDEYGDPAPFPFFVDHGDPDLLEATRRGRHEEFAGAGWDAEVADPADPATFAAAVLDPGLAARSPHRETLAATTELVRLRRELAVVHDPAATTSVRRNGTTIVVERQLGAARTALVLHFDGAPATVTVAGDVRFDSHAPEWGGDGAVAVRVGANLRVAPWSATLLA